MFVSRLCLLLVLASVGCRGGSLGQDSGEKAHPGSSVAPASSTVPEPAPRSPPVPPPTSPLPRLKPIAPRPFPEGATEQAVCEAIDSEEPDLWVRFGHLVPAYLIGAIYILEAGPELEEKIYQYIASDYVYTYHSQLASCRGELTLLYIRTMFEESELDGKPFGRKHLSAALERRLGVKTRESFQFNYERQRLADFCRQDAELCERLVKLDRSAHREGLCGMALVAAGILPTATEQHLDQCLSLPATTKACAYYAYSDARDRERCSCSIRESLDLTLSSQCRRALNGGIHP